MCVVCDYFKARGQKWWCARCGRPICLDADGHERAYTLPGQFTTCSRGACVPVIFHALVKARMKKNTIR